MPTSLRLRPTRPRTLALVLALVAGLVVVAVGLVGARAASGGNGQGNSGSGAGNGGSTSGSAGQALTAKVTSVSAVAPGRRGAVTVSVTNPNNQAVVLTRLSGQVTGTTSGSRAGLPKCSASWIELTPWTGARTVAAKGVAALTMPVTFTNLGTTNQDNCKGVSYTFSFLVNGQQA